MVNIRVSPEQLRSVATSLDGQYQEISNVLRNIVATVDGLQSEWTGLAQVDYAQTFHDQVPSMQTRLAETMEHLINDLRHIADEFERADQTAVAGVVTGVAAGVAAGVGAGTGTKSTGSGSDVDGTRNELDPVKPKTDLEKKIYGLKNEINGASGNTVSPELIAAILQDEMDKRDLVDDLQDAESEFIQLYEGKLESTERWLLEKTVGKPIEDMSLGIAQMKPNTVYDLIENGYIAEPPNWDSDKLDITLSWLADDKAAPKLVSAYLNRISDCWMDAGHPVDSNMLATLYSHSNALSPHSGPQMNDRGQGIVDNMKHIGGVLRYDGAI